MKSPEEYEDLARLVRDAFSGGLTLDSLVGLMRSRGPSSLYFAGADRDHPYFLHTDRVAIGLSALPEDESKSKRPKRHPHQHEVIFVLDGALRLELLKDGQWQPFDLTAGQVRIIYPNECHRILSSGQQAVFLFVKTLPAKEPREFDCG